MIGTAVIVGIAWAVAVLLLAGPFALLLWLDGRRRRREPDVMHLRVSEVPGCIRESVRTVFVAHGMAVVDRRGELLTDERFEGLLRELGNNSAQGLYSVDLALEDE